MDQETHDEALWRLYIIYFKPCDVFYMHHRRVKPEFFAGGVQAIAVGVEFMTFTQYWLASLFVVSEGWRESKFSSGGIDAIINAHWDDLRRFRNFVFHFQMSDDKHEGFLDPEKFNWAEQLHAQLRSYLEAHARPPELLKELRTQAKL